MVESKVLTDFILIIPTNQNVNNKATFYRFALPILLSVIFQNTAGIFTRLAFQFSLLKVHFLNNGIEFPLYAELFYPEVYRWEKIAAVGKEDLLFLFDAFTFGL